MATNSEWVLERIRDAVLSDGMLMRLPFPSVTKSFFVWRDGDAESGEFEFEPGVDKTTVEREIRTFNDELLEACDQANVSMDFVVGYVVLPDGRWHVDKTQAFLMSIGEPHFAPREWLERKLEIRERNR